MKRYIIKLSYPEDQVGGRAENTALAKVKISKEIDAIYDAVGWFEDNIFPALKKRLSKHQINKRVRLRRILNIHNGDGIRSVRQIKRLITSINKGEHALAPSGMPNIKILMTRNKKLFLFDGHHSMLAYMAVGRKYLDTIPHLLIEHSNNGHLDDSDIFNFFGGLLSNIKGTNWLGYAINWQAPKEKQLCPRVQKNMGELFDVLRFQNELIK